MATDSAAHDTTYYPADITGFGFADRSGNHFFLVKPLKDSALHFQEVIVAGPHGAVYFYDYPNLSNYGSGETAFTFEKPDGAYLFLKNYDKLSTLQEKIKAFYGDTDAIRQFY